MTRNSNLPIALSLIAVMLSVVSLLMIPEEQYVVSFDVSALEEDGYVCTNKPPEECSERFEHGCISCSKTFEQ